MVFQLTFGLSFAIASNMLLLDRTPTKMVEKAKRRHEQLEQTLKEPTGPDDNDCGCWSPYEEDTDKHVSYTLRTARNRMLMQMFKSMDL